MSQEKKAMPPAAVALLGDGGALPTQGRCAPDTAVPTPLHGFVLAANLVSKMIHGQPNTSCKRC
jgi:hypothetical protein